MVQRKSKLEGVQQFISPSGRAEGMDVDRDEPCEDWPDPLTAATNTEAEVEEHRTAHKGPPLQQ